MPTLKGDEHTGLRDGSRPDRRLGDARRQGSRARGFRIQPVDRRPSQAAKAEGFDATEDLDDALSRAADSNALIVLAVPVPALPLMLGHIRDIAPDCPLTDVTSVKACVLDEVRSFGLLDALRRRPSDGRHRPLGVGGRQCPTVRRRAVGDQRRRPRRPARVEAGDGPRAGLRRGGGARPAPTSTTPPRRPSLTCRICSPRRSPSPRARCRWRSRSPRDRSVTGPASPPPHRIWCGRCARPTPTSCCPSLDRTLDLLTRARDALAANSPLTDLVEPGHAARMRYDSFSRPEIVTIVVGEDNWRNDLAAAGRAGGVIRSALPVLGSRG